MNTPESLASMEQHTALLYEASKLLGAPPNLKSAMEAVLTGALHRHGLSACLFLTDPGEGPLRVEFSLGLSSVFAGSIRVPKGEGVIGMVYASAVMRQVEAGQRQDGDPLLDTLIQRQRLSAVLILPLKADGRIIGAAVYGSQTARQFPEEAARQIAELTDHLALALYNGRRVADLEASRSKMEAQVASTGQELSKTNARLVQKVRELKTVYDLALATAASRRVEDIVRVMITGIKELIDVQGAAFFLFEGTSDTLEPAPPASISRRPPRANSSARPAKAAGSSR